MEQRAHSYNYETPITQEHIGAAIVQERDRMLESTHDAGIAHIAYYLDADTTAYRTLKTFSNIAPPGEYEAARNNLNEGTKFNLITHLGERYNVGLSTYQYEIQNGMLYPKDGSEPLLDMIVRGRDFRKQNGSSIYDQRREAAEVTGMIKSQAILTNPNTQIGTSTVSNSARGEVSEEEQKAGIKSIYKHNFYDVFTLKEQDGRRYVEARRYSSALTRAQAAEKFSEVDDKRYSTSKIPSDVFFLSNPVVIAPEKTADDIHAWLHEEHDFMSEQEFQEEILVPCMPILQFYLNALTKNPDDLETRNLAYNAFLVKADEGADKVRAKKAGVDNISWLNDYASSSLSIEQQVALLGRQQAQTRDTGCGFSAGVDVGGSSLGVFSVMEFGVMSDKYGSRKFNCPAVGCGKENIRLLDQLLAKCQHCGSTEVACKPGEEKEKVVSFESKKKEKILKEGQRERIVA